MAIGEGLNLRHREAIYLDLAQPWVRRTASFRARGGRLPAIVRGFLRVLDFVTPARRLGISLEEVRQISSPVRNSFGIWFPRAVMLSLA